MTDDSTPEREHTAEFGPVIEANATPSDAETSPSDADTTPIEANATLSEATLSEATLGEATLGKATLSEANAGESEANTGEADPAPQAASPTDAQTGYVLSRRDRTAVKLIDWAVKYGTPEFQAHYRPVSDELFTHHFIDPTAKPAFVPPAIVSVEQLDETSDPLEIIRSHIGLVVDDRQARDKARLDALAHYETASTALAELQVRAAGLEADLAETTERLRVADAEIESLNARLETEVSGLHSSYTAQLDELRGQLETDSASARAAHEAEIARLTSEHEAKAARLASDHDTTLGGLTTGHETALAELESQHSSDLADAEARHANELSALRTQNDEKVAAVGLELAAAVAAAELTTRHLKEARLESAALTAQRDRAIAEGSEWRSRLQQVVAGLASTADVGEWSDSNAPDARLVEFIEETQLDLTTQLELAQATLDEIEDVATAQLVDETETSDYAIGANDAAVLVLNSLYRADEEPQPELEGEGEGAGELEEGSASPAVTGLNADAAEETEAEVEAGADAESEVETGAALSDANPASADASAASDETVAGDADFEASLRGDVDIEFDEFAAESEAHRAS